MWTRARSIVAGGLIVLLAGCATARASVPAQRTGGALPAAAVVPQPLYLQVNDDAFTWPSRVRIRASTPDERGGAEMLRAYLRANGVAVSIVGGRTGAEVTINIPGAPGSPTGLEGYALAVSRSEITIVAQTPHGLFYALQTLEQISAGSGGRLASRAVSIVDRPAYRWRGIHLDVARHFFPVPVIERYIAVAARYKLNVFQWHLTDDQAWRLESSRYPALTAGTLHYSRDDVRRIVAYAARRYVTVVPEIDLPGHAGAALRAYPKLACAHETLCMNADGLAFARNVLAEAAAEFPSPYLHAGGDEVPPPALTAQPRFTHDVERFVESRGRRFAGWDDILTPQLWPRALLTVWTSSKRAAAAAQRGNDVVDATGALHFDAVQGDPAQEPRGSPHVATLEQVYDHGVMPRGLDAAAAAHVIGTQANVWTERIATPDHLFFMTLPRELALAENAWTPRSRKSWASFLARLPAQLAWLDAHGYAFRIPNAAFALTGGRTVFESVPGHVQSVRAWTAATAVTVSLSVPLDGAVVRYTTDGTVPRATSPAYRLPFTVAVGRTAVVLRAAAFLHGRTGAVSECAVSRVSAAALRTHRSAAKSWSALVSP
ncbi:MAG TPA: family 20 glycosylhydrolase [Candidatus Elarobacter sp.]|nr:family 20 glycosylhydrolase [Candidatus Elarobacter sp.]